MKMGPFPNPFSPDCIPLEFNVDEKWLDARRAANPGKSDYEIVMDHVAEELDRQLTEMGKRVLSDMKEMQRG